MVPHLNHEVMEVIFSHIDGKSLARCEQVCKLWKEVVQSLTKRTHIWKTCCEMEIDEDVRIELLNSCHPTWHILCPSNSEWRVIYETWCQWHHVGKWGFITNTVSGEDFSLDPVTCMKTSGRYVISGHTNGGVFLWDSNGSVKVASHARDVTDLSMMVYSGECRNNSPQMKHDLVVSSSRDRTIQINPLGYNYKELHGFPIVIVEEDRLHVAQVRTFGNMCAFLSCCGRISLWQLNASACNKNVPEVKKLPKLQIYVPDLKAVTIWGNRIIQVSAVASNGLCMPICHSYSHFCKLLIPDAEKKFSSEGIRSTIVKFFAWRYGVSIMLTDEHIMYTSLYGHRLVRYNTMPHLYSYPVTVLLYGEILLLGMDCGTLYMYLLSHIRDLLTLDLRQVYWKHSLCEDPITALDIAETSDGPVIAATTRHNIYRIHFIPPRLR